MDGRNVNDQRVIGRSPLDFEQSPDGRVIHGVNAEAINRFGGESNKAATPQAFRSAQNVLLIRPYRIDSDDLGHRPPVFNMDAHATTGQISYRRVTGSSIRELHRTAGTSFRLLNVLNLISTASSILSATRARIIIP